MHHYNFTHILEIFLITDSDAGNPSSLLSFFLFFIFFIVKTFQLTESRPAFNISHHYLFSFCPEWPAAPRQQEIIVRE